jgi:hypothetical protein
VNSWSDIVKYAVTRVEDVTISYWNWIERNSNPEEKKNLNLVNNIFIILCRLFSNLWVSPASFLRL